MHRYTRFVLALSFAGALLLPALSSAQTGNVVAPQPVQVVNPNSDVTTGLNKNIPNPTITFTPNTPNTPLENIQAFFQLVIDIINKYLIVVLFAVTILFFLYGVAKFFIFSHGNEEQVQQGQKFMMWSVIAFVVMFSMWGIINLAMGTLPLDNTTRPDIPSFGSQGK